MTPENICRVIMNDGTIYYDVFKIPSDKINDVRYVEVTEYMDVDTFIQKYVV